MPVEELLKEVATALEKKSRKTVNRAALDALVYMNLRGRHLYPVPAVIVDPGAIAELGWRSVSVLSPPFAAVVFAAPSAPAFLRERAGRVTQLSGIPWEGRCPPTSVANRRGSCRHGCRGVRHRRLRRARGHRPSRSRGERDRRQGRLPAAGVGWVVEAQSALTGMWRTLTPRVSLEEATRRLGRLSQRYVGAQDDHVFKKHRWRLREVSTGETVLGELLGG